MDFGWMVVLFVFVLALIGFAILYRERQRHATRSPSGSAFQRQADSYTPGRYYSQMGKNPWIVEPQKEQEADSTARDQKQNRDKG